MCPTQPGRYCPAQPRLWSVVLRGVWDEQQEVESRTTTEPQLGGRVDTSSASRRRDGGARGWHYREALAVVEGRFQGCVLELV